VLEGDETEIVVLVFSAENHVFLVREVRLAAALPFLVVDGLETFEDAPPSGVGVVVGLVHYGEDVLHFPVQTVALAVGQLLGHTLFIFLWCVGAALYCLGGAVVDAATQVVVVLGGQTTRKSQEYGDRQNLLIFHNILYTNMLY
jgi:hypothetical protein